MTIYVEHLQALEESKDILEFWGNCNPKCPHCGSDYDIQENEAWHLYEEQDCYLVCPQCEREYLVQVEVSYTYTTDEQE